MKKKYRKICFKKRRRFLNKTKVTSTTHGRGRDTVYNRDCNRPKYLHFVIRAIDFSKVPGARFPCHESHDSCSRAPTPLSPFLPSPSPPLVLLHADRLDQRTTTVENALNNIEEYRETSWRQVGQKKILILLVFYYSTKILEY